MAGKSPTQRTLEYLREQGWPNVQVVEKWIAPAKRRKDLFMFADVLAMHPEWGHLYVQATSGANAAARLHKMRLFAEDQIEDALACGSRVEIHGWRKLKGMGRRQWFPYIINVTLEVLHDMNDERWDVVRKYMNEIWQELNGVTADDGDLHARTVLDDYPPSIVIAVSLDAGADGDVPYLTKKERERASELARQLTKQARASWPLLALKQAYRVYGAGSEWELRYSLRPSTYSDVPGVSDVE